MFGIAVNGTYFRISDAGVLEYSRDNVTWFTVEGNFTVQTEVTE